MRNGMMDVKVKVEGCFLGIKVKESMTVSVREGATLKDVFKALDRKNRLGKRFFRDLPTLIDVPELIINGEKFVLSKELERRLSDGDEVVILANSSR